MNNWTPAASLYTPQGERKYLTGPERERFIATAGSYPCRDAATLCLAIAHTGCRISEALSLYPTALQPATGLIAVRSLKKHGRLHVREIPAPDSLLEVLREYCTGRPADRRIWPVSRSHAWRLVKAVMLEAAIAPGIHATPKGLRHGFGLHAIRSGVPLNLVQRWLGHASMVTTAIYLQAMGTEEREIASRMWTHAPGALSPPV